MITTKAIRGYRHDKSGNLIMKVPPRAYVMISLSTKKEPLRLKQMSLQSAVTEMRKYYTANEIMDDLETLGIDFTGIKFD